MTDPIVEDPMSHPEVTITTGARLHFGLMDTRSPFGGAGVMVGCPETQVMVSPRSKADDGTLVECGGENAALRVACPSSLISRVLPVVERLETWLIDQRSVCPSDMRRHVWRLRCPQVPPTHCGLGSGTQLSMAITEALMRAVQLTPFDSDRTAEPYCPPSTEQLAVLSGRGLRSAVGVHGYRCGGMLWEASDGATTKLNPLRKHVALPDQWHVAIFRPAGRQATISGSLEQQQFGRLQSASEEQRERLDDILQNELVSAAESSDFERFTSSVREYNRLSGELFQDVQGGVFNGQKVTDLVASLESAGVAGVGQSSWGPGVFGWFPDPATWQSFATDQLLSLRDAELIAVSTVMNRGRSLQCVSRD